MLSTRESGAPGKARGPAGPGAASVEAAARLQSIIGAAATPEDALEPALRGMVEATGGAGGAICFFDQRKEVLRLAAECNLSDEGCRRLRNVRRGDVAGWDMPLHGLLNRRAYLIDSAAKNRYVPPLLEPPAVVRSIVCLPIFQGGTPLGSLLIVATGARVLTERDIRNLEPSLRELSALIEAIRLRAPTLTPVSRSSAAPPPQASSTPPPPNAAEAAEAIVLRGRLEELEARVADEHARAEELAAKLEEATTALAAVRPDEREALRLRVAELETRAEAQTRRAADLETQLTATASRDAEVEGVRTRLAAAEARAEAEAQRAGELETRLAAAASQEGGEAEALRAQLAELETRVAAERARADEAARRLDEATAQDRQPAGAHVAPAGQEADALRAKVVDQQQEIERLEPAAHAASSLERDLRATREREMALRGSVAALEAEVARLRGNASGAKAGAQKRPAPAAPPPAPASRGRATAASPPASGAQPAPVAQPTPAAQPAESAQPAPQTPAPARKKGGFGIVVVGTGDACSRLGGSASVDVVPPDEQLGARLAAAEAERIIVNLTTPGALHALAGLRVAGSTLRFWACLPLGDGTCILPLGMVEPVLLPAKAAVLAETLAGYAPRGTRVVTLGRDVEAFAGFRQSVARQGLSVSMAWDAKQATDLIGMVRPEVAIIDLESLREGCALVASMAGAEPLPHLILLLGEKDPAQGFAQALRDPALKSRALPVDRLLGQITKRAEARPAGRP